MLPMNLNPGMTVELLLMTSKTSGRKGEGELTCQALDEFEPLCFCHGFNHFGAYG